MRSREARSSASRSSDSACSRASSSAIAAVAATASTSSGIVVERRVVDEHPELAAVALDRRRRTVATRRAAARPAVRCRRCRSARPARDRPGRADGSPSVLARPASSCTPRRVPSSRKRSASPPRASRERSRPQSSAAGTVSSAVFRTQKSGITGDSDEQRGERRRRTGRRTGSRPGSAAALAGAAARPNASARRSRTRRRATRRSGRPAGPSSSALAISASGRTRSRLSSCSRNSITRELEDEEADEEHPDEHAVDGRDEPAAGHEAQDQRGVDDDPHLAEPTWRP